MTTYKPVALFILDGWGNRETAASLTDALHASYRDGVTDEFVLPVALEVGDRDVTVQPGGLLIFYNFRADRMHQIVTTFMFPDFDGFERSFIEDVDIVTMTNHEDRFTAQVAFPEVEITNPLADVLSKAGKKQFHAAETEKYAHVTYFFNGGEETPFEGEERHLEPSPKVATYDLKPEMSACELAAAVDECAGMLVDAVVAKGGVALVTADHGNCERMLDHYTGEPHTYHTTQPVSFIVIGTKGYQNLRPRGILADVSPTILELLGVAQPPEMTAHSLLEPLGK